MTDNRSSNPAATPNRVLFSPLRNVPIGIDDYESGMEASVSSMASEEEEQREHIIKQKHFNKPINLTSATSNHVLSNNNSGFGSLRYNSNSATSTTTTGSAKVGLNASTPTKKHHKRTSSSESTDSNAPASMPTASISTHGTTINVNNEHLTESPLQIVTPVTTRLPRKTFDNITTPTSGYDGDTEGPLIEGRNSLS